MAIKIKSKLPTKQEPKQEPKQEVKEIYPDFIDDDGYVNKYDYDGRQYYTTSISMKGPKGNPGPPGRMGKDGITPHINPENHHWMIGDIDTGVNAERTSIVVDTLPTPSEETKDQIYVAPSEHTETGDIYSEYVTVYKNGAYSWEKMGTPIDMSHVAFWEDTQQQVEPTDYDPQTQSEHKFIIQTFSGSTLNASINTYYRALSNVSTLTIQLPNVTDSSYLQGFIVNFTTGSNPTVTLLSSNPIYYYDGYSIESNKTYELNITYNGANWIVARGIINTSQT